MRTRGQRQKAKSRNDYFPFPIPHSAAFTLVELPAVSATGAPRTGKHGFTLVELLVVIAIIAILAAILLPAMNAAIRKGEEAQALSEVKSIETAVKAYLNEYSKFPHSSGANFDHSYGESGTQDNEYLMNVLRSVVGNGNGGTGTNNPRKIVFLEVAENSLSGANFVDPWGNQYRVTCDTQFDNDCEPPGGAGFGTVPNRNVIVWSRGWKPAPTSNDFIRSWK